MFSCMDFEGPSTSKTAETHIYLLDLWKKQPICCVIISLYIKCCRDGPDPRTVKAENYTKCSLKCNQKCLRMSQCNLKLHVIWWRFQWEWSSLSLSLSLSRSGFYMDRPVLSHIIRLILVWRIIIVLELSYISYMPLSSVLYPEQ